MGQGRSNHSTYIELKNRERTQPTLMLTAGGTDLLTSALSVSAIATTTGTITSGLSVPHGTLLDIDCESTGTNADSENQVMTLLVVRLLF